MLPRIHVFIGTKAQLIKMGPVMYALQQAGIPYRFIHSGQHRETMDDLIANFGIKKPDVYLYEGRDITGIIQMLVWALKIVMSGMFRPEALWGSREKGFVLNHGDTFSTLLGTLLAKLHRHKAVHVESGLRSFNYFHPFPEEIVRVLTIAMSDIAFAPGQWACENLRHFRGVVINTEENTLLDSTRQHLVCTPAPGLRPEVPYAVASIHRFENIFQQERLSWIVDQLITASAECLLLFVMHKPTVIKLHEFGLMDKLEQCPGIELRPRYDHIDFLHLVAGAEFVITDGGSNQEECHYMGKPCLIMRTCTERLEGIGQNAVLSNYDEAVIRDFLVRYRTLGHPSLLEGRVSPSLQIAEYLRGRVTGESC